MSYRYYDKTNKLFCQYYWQSPRQTASHSSFEKLGEHCVFLQFSRQSKYGGRLGTGLGDGVGPKLIPKKPLTKFRIAQAAKTIIRPIKAEVIVFWAEERASLSPPAVIHFIPPIKRRKKKTTTATIITRPRRLGTSCWMLWIFFQGLPMGEPSRYLAMSLTTA